MKIFSPQTELLGHPRKELPNLIVRGTFWLSTNQPWPDLLCADGRIMFCPILETLNPYNLHKRSIQLPLYRIP